MSTGEPPPADFCPLQTQHRQESDRIMSRRKPTKLDPIAQKLIDRHHASLFPGEYEYVSTAANLVRQQIVIFFDGTGAQPPELKTVKNWFYQDCPDWAIAILSRAVIS
ncbi:MAG: hypothetical protein RM049_26715 [Nostoc sp. DedQUE04]|uniref:hypothetical protein n=1 Tax=Nostoc sp. DedQUE04 TaxID=3075390 RepID=UPI002AD4BAB9|nr:hypothetical protein [Nostoc sp. DedQUE04]MDZ8138853.1 hypothetical protein [Nostoc sp. DedQUE04]